jgi:hypothetical protein
LIRNFKYRRKRRGRDAPDTAGLEASATTSAAVTLRVAQDDSEQKCQDDSEQEMSGCSEQEMSGCSEQECGEQFSNYEFEITNLKLQI